jgi:hypothetical protein
MRPRSGLAIRLAAISSLALVAVPAPVAAQGAEALTPVPGAFCTLITNEEASQAFGIELVLTGISGKSCTWSPPGSFGSDASLVPTIGIDASLDEVRLQYADYPGGIEDITVGGQPGLLRVNDDFWRSGNIFTEALGEVLAFSWNDFEGLAPDVDTGAALTQVMEAALPRMSSITFAEPTQRPLPSFRTDAELTAKFPKTIGGQPVNVQSFFFADMMAMGGTDPEDVQQINDALAPFGKSINDLTIAFANVGTDPQTNITAVRVIGGDARAILTALLPTLIAELDNPQTTAGQIAGRDVTIVTEASGDVTVYYASGDTIWSIQAAEPALSEVIGQLP